MATTTIEMCAYPARRVREGGYSALEVGMSIGRATPRRRTSVDGLHGITRAVAEFGREMREYNPDASFTISVTMARGQRKPRGFDDAEKAGTFGHHAFLRDDAGKDATSRRLACPPAGGETTSTSPPA